MYKDDLEAAHQRIQALEQELRRLRRGREEARLPPPRRSSVDRAAGLLLLVLLLAGLVVAVSLAVRRPPWGTPAALLLIVGAALLPVWLRRRVIARPCEWLVRTDGRAAGAEVVGSGRALRPLRGRLVRLGRQPWPLQWGVEAPLSGGERVALQGTAWLAVSDDPRRAPRALGLEPAAARAAIEGALTGWLAGCADLSTTCVEVAEAARPAVDEAAEGLGLQLLYHGVDGVRR